jgi:hypothetical protein
MTTNKLLFFRLGFSRGLTTSHIEQLGILRKVTQKTLEYKLDSTGLGQGIAKDSYEYGNKLSSYMRYG